MHTYSTPQESPAILYARTTRRKLTQPTSLTFTTSRGLTYVPGNYRVPEDASRVVLFPHGGGDIDTLFERHHLRRTGAHASECVYQGSSVIGKVQSSASPRVSLRFDATRLRISVSQRLIRFAGGTSAVTIREYSRERIFVSELLFTSKRRFVFHSV